MASFPFPILYYSSSFTHLAKSYGFKVEMELQVEGHLKGQYVIYRSAEYVIVLLTFINASSLIIFVPRVKYHHNILVLVKEIVILQHTKTIVQYRENTLLKV